jgi:hypothetical protein
MSTDLKKALANAIEEMAVEREMANQEFSLAIEKLGELLVELHEYPEIYFQSFPKECRATLTFPIPSAKVDSTISYDSQAKVFYRNDVVDIEAGDLLFALAGTTREEQQTHYSFSFNSAIELAESYIKHFALAVNTIQESRKSAGESL